MCAAPAGQGLPDYAELFCLTNFSFQLHRLNIIGDATWVNGRVTAKRVDDAGRQGIDIEL